MSERIIYATYISGKKMKKYHVLTDALRCYEIQSPITWLDTLINTKRYIFYVYNRRTIQIDEYIVVANIRITKSGIPSDSLKREALLSSI